MNTVGEGNARPSHRSRVSIREWIALLGGASAVFITAALFGAGQANRTGYLYQLGLDLSQVPSDFNDTLYWGYVTGTPKLIAWLLAGAIALLGAACIVWLAKWISAISGRWALVRKLKEQHRSDSETAVRAHEGLAAFGVLTLVLLYFVLLSYLALSEAYKSGVQKGQKLLTALQSDSSSELKSNTQWIEIVLASTPSRVERGYRLVCTESLCSIYDPTADGGIVRVVSLDDLQEIRVLKSQPPSAPIATPST